MREFEIIAQYFSELTPIHEQAVLGVGDDAAIWQPSPDKQLVLAVDTLLADRHFFGDDPPDSVAYKALAVNLSDMAAMGADPKAFLLSLSLPKADEAWLASFAKGLATLSHEHNVMLIGGDTTQGPLSVSITILGEVSPNQALTRGGAQKGDDIYVSGELGLAAMGLHALRHRGELYGTNFDECVQAYRRPTPHIQLGKALVGVANSCIDISDGFMADLGHILEQSDCGARIDLKTLPISKLAHEYETAEQALAWALSGGDDYQLVFTANADKRDAIASLSNQLSLPLTRVGQITPGHDLIVLDEHGDTVDIATTGWEHFSDD